ncbi:hypothetical protein OSB04_001122 [Centaurea solstitialis]|uniref:SWIM-type domain-containing protein n=1 Tax=Centaurea solstitialis TaxID=347529 RepID=A0AA38U324_9ASTR|nr:hypothetical protein OSB04_001122 [Centaurea solstitialis]
MTLALGLKFLEEGFEFKTVRSTKRRYEAVCVYENCNWRIYATSIGDSEMFQVHKLNDVHICSRTQMHPAHRQATRRVLAHLPLDKTGDISRTIRGCDIVRDIKSRYKIDISYWQAWRAKWRAIFLIEGNPAESFTRLPQYFYNVKLQNPDTVTDITTDVAGRFATCFFALGCAILNRGCDIVRDIKSRYKIDISYWQAWRAKWRAIFLIEGNPAESFTRLPQYFYNVKLRNPDTVTDITTDVAGRFATCFFALGCAIQTFRSGLLRKVLIVDCAHLKGDYLGIMFLAVAMDANNQVVPIAIGVAKSESGESCTYFFQMLRRCIGEMAGLVFMTDRSGPLRQAINTVYPTAHHACCCWHLYMNIKAKDASIEYNKKIFWQTCKAYTRYEFDLHMSALRAAVPGASLLDRVNPNRWSRAHFPGVPYNILSSNYVECMNAHSRFARRGAIVGLMEYFRSFQQEWYSKRRDLAGLLTNPLTPWAELRVQRRAVKSASWIARDIGYGEYEVQDGYRDAIVNYVNKTCTCNKWQLSGLPCGHAIAVAAKHNLTDCSQLAFPYFTVDNLKATYASVIYLVGPPQAWRTPDEPLMTVRPPEMKTKPGAKSKHKRIPSRGEGSRVQRCSRCQQPGHTRNQCTESLPSQRPSEWTRQMDDNLPSQRPSGSRQGEATTTQQTDDEGRRYNFDLNDDLNIDLNY